MPPLGSEPVDLIRVDTSGPPLQLVRGGAVLRTCLAALGWRPRAARRAAGRRGQARRRLPGRPGGRFYLSPGPDGPQAEDVARAAAGGWAPGGDAFVRGQPGWLGLTPRERVAGGWTDGCLAVADARIESTARVAGVGTAVEVVS